MLRDVFRRLLGRGQEDAVRLIDAGGGIATRTSAQHRAARRILADKIDQPRRNAFHRHQLERLFRDQAFGHAGARGGGERVDADIVLRPFQMQHIHEANQAHLGRAIIGLAEIAVNARRRAGHHHAAIIGLAHDLPHRLGTGRRAHQMHVHDRLEILERHLGEALVAQDSGIVDEDIDPAPRLHGAVHHVGDFIGPGHVGAMGDRLAAVLRDLVDDRLRRTDRAARAVHRPAQIIDHDFRAARSQCQRMRAAKPCPCARDNGHSAVKPDIAHGCIFPWLHLQLLLRQCVRAGFCCGYAPPFCPAKRSAFFAAMQQGRGVLYCTSDRREASVGSCRTSVT